MSAVYAWLATWSPNPVNHQSVLPVSDLSSSVEAQTNAKRDSSSEFLTLPGASGTMLIFIKYLKALI